MIVANQQSDLLSSVSVVIPAHNEAENLTTLIGEIRAAHRGGDFAHRWDLEIIVIDDHSSDATPAVLADLRARIDNLKTYRLARRSGQSTALAAGFDVATGDVLVTIDADLQNDPADIPRLVEALGDADLAIGWRRDRKDPLSKRWISRVANAVRNWVTSENVRDTGCGLKAFHAECARSIPRFDGMHRFFPTLARMYGFRVVEVPVHHRPRQHGRTHYNLFNRSVRPMADLFAVRWLQKRALRYQLLEEKSLVHC